MRRLKKIILSLCLLTFCNVGWTQVINLHNSESLPELNGTTVIQSQDQYFEEIVADTYDNFYILNQEAYVELKYNQSLKTLYNDDWLADITFDVTLVYSDGTYEQIEDEVLFISFYREQPYREKALKRYPDAISVHVSNICVNCKGLAWSEYSNETATAFEDPIDAFLEVGINSQKRFELQETSPIITTSVQDGDLNQLEIAWNKPIGALSYELEWYFYELGELESTAVLDNQTPNWRDAARIHLNKNHYALPLAYPKGQLVYRVRAIGENILNGNRAVTSWSIEATDLYGSIGAINKYFNASSFSPNLNWVVSQTFGENGKRAVTLSFADDQMRTRQSVSFQNTDNLAIVHSNVFDYQNRETVQTLPSPQPNQGYKFYSNQLWDNTNQKYFDYSYFDIWATDQSFNYLENNQLLEANSPLNPVGPGTYYSDQNALDLGHHGEFTPDAEGYPYARTIIASDGTGRVLKSGGVGVNHAIKDGHDHVTSYFYGNPNQEELDSLFGNEVGFASQYLKTVSVDPDGQGHVVITDLKGRTVTEYMTGSNPSSLLALDHLETDEQGQIVGSETFIDLGVFNLEGSFNDSYNAEHTFIVTEPSLHSFYYGLEPNPFLEGCLEVNISPVYDFEFRIYRLVDASDLTQGWELIGVYPQQSFTAWEPQDIIFTQELIPGTYKAVKELTLNEQGLQNAIEQFLASDDCYSPEVQPIFNCTDCGGECINSYYQIIGSDVFRIMYDGEIEQIAENLVYPIDPTLSNVLDAIDLSDLAPGVSLQDVADWRLEIEQCEEECLTPPEEMIDWCTFHKVQLVSDMSPGGQYFDNTPASITSNGVYVEDYPANDWLLVNIGLDPNAIYSNFPSGCLMNTTSSLISGISSWDELRSNWSDFEGNDDFIEDLIQFHPEYCQLEARCGVSFKYNGCGTEGDSVQLDYWSYINAVEESYTNGNAISGELLNPLSLSSGGGYFSNTSIGAITQNNNYIPSSLLTAQCSNDLNDFDWFIFGELTIEDNYLERDEIESIILANLGNFIEVQIPNGFGDCYANGNYMSIWYFIDNPDNISSLNPQGLCPDLVNIFDEFHGVNGFFNQGITFAEERFFQSVYRFYRDLAFSEFLENVDALETCQSGICAPIQQLNNGGGLDFFDGGIFGGLVDGFIIHFPENPLYTELTDTWDWLNGQAIDETSPYILDFNTIQGMADPDVEGEMADESDDLLGEIVCGAEIISILDYLSSDFTSGELDVIEGFLISLCQNGWDMFGTAGFNYALGEITPVSFEGQTFYDINDFLDYYSSGSWTEILTIPAPELTPAEAAVACNCNVLEDILFGYNSSEGTTLTISGISAPLFLTYLQEEFYDSGDVLPTLQDLSDWSSGCSNTSDLALNLFPPLYDCSVMFEIDNTELECEVAFQELEDIAFAEQSEEYFQAAIDEFTDTYMEAWYENLEGRETYKMKYNKLDYQHTLYYYDQAGNLVKTVPPAGVVPLSAAEIDLTQDYRNEGAGDFMNPSHKMTTLYSYNSIQQMVNSITPHGGETHFWYDNLDRIIASQNAKQFVNGCYSYTIYDQIGRPYESGQVCSVILDAEIIYDLTTFTSIVLSGSREDVSYTWYDSQVASTEVLAAFEGQSQLNLRNRVSMMAYLPKLISSPELEYTSATAFSYDVHGNATEVIQEIRELHPIGQGVKKMKYTFDVFSGNVREVWYQEGEWDQFAHRYCYDADNRLQSVFTSDDGRNWSNDAKYFYYAHGPLARKEIGDKQVAAEDFAYTIQGWLKGVNSATLRHNRDIGKDGYDNVNSPKVNSHFAEDAYGFTLDYFLGDYKSVNYNGLETDEFQIQSLSIFGSDFRELYTGNIASISQAYSQLESPLNDEHMNHHTALYSYDQLHRIKAAGYVITDMNQASLKNNNLHPLGSATSDQFKSTYSYDPNGNLETLTRNGHTQDALSDLPMDDFVYSYFENTGQGAGFEAKKLNHVVDNFDGDGSPWNSDLEGQSSGNYEYDEIGQIIKDVEGGIGWIEWNVQNKIERIVRPNLIEGQYLTDIEFQYDALGNRISKILKPRDTNGNILDETFWRKDYYIRDANGQEMAIYSQQMNLSTGTIYDLSFLLNATHLYGSSRLGVESKHKGTSSILNNVQFVGVQHTFGGGIGIIQESHINSANYNNEAFASSNAYFEKELGFKQFEISNHLGNVTAIIQDCKTLEIDLETLYNVYRPRISSLSDYYPFGMQMPGRQFSQGEYRYGFNGKEKDNELAGEGNSIHFEFREYDSRIARYSSLDPLSAEYPWQSPYVYHRNSPVAFIDWLGLGDPIKPKDTGSQEADNIITANEGTGRKRGFTSWFWHVDENGDGDWLEKMDFISYWFSKGYSLGVSEVNDQTVERGMKSGPSSLVLYSQEKGEESFKFRVGIHMGAMKKEFYSSEAYQAYKNGFQEGYESFNYSAHMSSGAIAYADPTFEIILTVSTFGGYSAFRSGLRLGFNRFAAKGGTSVVKQAAVHGNSLKSLKPTWGYKLYSADGTFLKNGITNKLIPEMRYTKAFMSDKYMVPFKQFPNRLGAYQWEFGQNQILRGPLNLNMH